MKIAQNTREKLLDSAFSVFYKQGFQGANVATILEEVGINKGSMYHFFKSKKALGLAVVEERIKRNLVAKYEDIKSVEALFEVLQSAPDVLVYGCPLNKMSQEMVYIDEDFKKVLSSTYAEFERLIAGILGGEEPKKVARMVIATYEGALMVYHLNHDRGHYHDTLLALQKRIDN